MSVAVAEPLDSGTLIRCPSWPRCRTILAHRLPDGTVRATVRVARTKRDRVFPNPPEIICDGCGAVWRDERTGR